MSDGLKAFVKAWIINTLAVAVAAQTVKGIHCETQTSLVIASLVLGILNAFLKPILLLLSLPLLLLTLGLFSIVINALLLFMVGQHVKDFRVDTFGAAAWGAVVISLITVILNGLTGSGNTRVTVRRGGPPKDPNDRGGGAGGGPVIDV